MLGHLTKKYNLAETLYRTMFAGLSMADPLIDRLKSIRSQIQSRLVFLERHDTYPLTISVQVQVNLRHIQLVCKLSNNVYEEVNILRHDTKHHRRGTIESATHINTVFEQTDEELITRWTDLFTSFVLAQRFNMSRMMVEEQYECPVCDLPLGKSKFIQHLQKSHGFI